MNYPGAIRLGLLLTAFTAAAMMPAQAQTRVHLTLDYRFEGPSAPFLVAADRGYYKAEGLDVTIDTAPTPLDPITRVGSGSYEVGFVDFNALIKYRDANPAAPVQAVFIVYNRPPYAIVGRKSRGVEKPKDLEGKKLGAPVADPTFAQWKIFAKTNNIDAAKVTVENVGMPVREPMLAAGQVDAITGFSFSTYVTLKDRGVPADDIVVMLMADYGVNLYGNAIIVNSKFAAENPQAVRGFLRAFVKGLKETIRNPRNAVESVLRRNDVAKKDDRTRTAAHGDQGKHRDTGGQGQRPRRRGSRAAGGVNRPDRAHLRVQGKAQCLRCVRRYLPAGYRTAQAALT